MTTTQALETYEVDASIRGKQEIARGYRDECREFAASWNSDEATRSFGPATARWTSGRGWHVTVTQWA